MLFQTLTKIAAVWTWTALSCMQAVAVDLQLSADTRLVFVSAAEARLILSTRDDFVARLSPFDRSARLKTDKPVDEAAYLAFVGRQTLDWSTEEQEALARAFENIRGKLSSLDLPFPERIALIKTNGLEEGGAAYTRGSAIIFPKNRLESGRSLEALLCHELFHVLSRHDRPLRERLYKVLGFQACAELLLPESLRERRITNPDGPTNDHCLKIKVSGKERWAIPILVSKSATYDPVQGGEFFNYLVFQLIVIEDMQAQPTTAPAIVDGQPILVHPKDAEGFFDQIGRNTNYIIHPDEILADNFVMIVQQKTDAPSPEILARIQSALTTAAR